MYTRSVVKVVFLDVLGIDAIDKIREAFLLQDLYSSVRTTPGSAVNDYFAILVHRFNGGFAGHEFTGWYIERALYVP